MKYNFTPYTSSGSGFRFDGLTVRTSQVTLSKGLMEKLDNPRFIRFMIDHENKLIMVTPAESSGNYVYSLKKRGVVNCVMYREMPKGRYSYLEKDSNSIICKLDNHE